MPKAALRTEGKTTTQSALSKSPCGTLSGTFSISRTTVPDSCTRPSSLSLSLAQAHVATVRTGSNNQTDILFNCVPPLAFPRRVHPIENLHSNQLGSKSNSLGRKQPLPNATKQTEIGGHRPNSTEGRRYHREASALAPPSGSNTPILPVHHSPNHTRPSLSRSIKRGIAPRVGIGYSANS